MSKRGDDSVAEAASMDQVRELLFGAQLKDMENRMQRQEERFIREVNDVKEALKQRLDSLENFMKSEVSSLLNRLKEEEQARDGFLKAEQRERQATVKNEQKERAEALKNEQKERKEAFLALNKELANTAEAFDRRLAKISSTADASEREIRQLLLSESVSLNNKIEERYQDALQVMAQTARQIRNDMVYRTALSGIFAEAVVELNTPWDASAASIQNADRNLAEARAGQENKDGK